jgi:TATA-binding protein-associated factor
MMQMQKSGEGPSKSDDNSKTKDQKTFKMLLFMRRLCTHPLLCTLPKPQLETGDVSSIQSFSDAPKFSALGDLLSSLRQANHRALVFAQSKVSLSLVERFLAMMNEKAEDAEEKLSWLRMDGNTPPLARGQIVERFNSDSSVDVLLLTTQVGGLGLTLTGADTVIFLEHDWNPQVDLQAMDRSHRLGQTRTVQVYRLIVKDMLEERIMGLQAFKLAVARAVVNEDNISTASMAQAGADVLSVVQDAAEETASRRPAAEEDAQAKAEAAALGGAYSKLVQQMDEIFKDDEFLAADVDEFQQSFGAR